MYFKKITRHYTIKRTNTTEIHLCTSLVYCISLSCAFLRQRFLEKYINTETYTLQKLQRKNEVCIPLNYSTFTSNLTSLHLKIRFSRELYLSLIFLTKWIASTCVLHVRILTFCFLKPSTIIKWELKTKNLQQI